MSADRVRTANGEISSRADGTATVRFERRLAHPAAAVWRSLTRTEHLRVWFVEILDYDASRLHFAEGAELRFVPKPDTGLPEGHGEVLRCDPPRLLEYTWDQETLRWEIHPDGDSACVLVFVNTVPGPEIAAQVAPGWQTGLDRLADSLDA
ncbi:SRPBCC domain-containing protein [Actinopolymorpha singaporensis]|uniref:Uncharacterized conserved protein YndB, AHSA1/START domain n=1 Tax=Actinopolymorpha singaporensis TaxID=117157 RepID=A0A1H1L4P6_9ACTN|nr:SRPBCC domain-containing protein [Actinopolymorpha singaporensis]SDR69551.1 Uncharacterized conserved protein YndB, AHSA1/START domain [Actinopolymorpha singaporensis]